MGQHWQLEIGQNGTVTDAEPRAGPAPDLSDDELSRFKLVVIFWKAPCFDGQ